MKSEIDKVKEFLLKVRQRAEVSPTLQTDDLQKFRYDLALEELNEYRQACQDGDLIEIFDALLDQLYILIGTAHLHGLADALKLGFEEVHRSNMTKMDENGEPIFGKNGKVIKSHLFEKPKLEEILKKVYSE